MEKRKILHEGILDLAGIQIPCYVLDDGTRVLSGSAMQNALKLQEETDNRSGTRLARYLGQKSLEPFIYKGKEHGHYNPIICYKGEQKINGYEATILADICEAFLEARNNISLSQRQKIIADQCEILIRGFARVGITALVDEATGYQYERERDALQIVLKAYIGEELLKWQKTFPDTFYQEIFRLNKWDYTVKGINKRPGVIGRWTNLFIYEQLPKGVLEELKAKTPKTPEGKYKAKFFQSLTPDIGHPKLNSQIYEVVGIMKISDNWQDFISNFNRKLNREKGLLEIDFDNI